MHDQTTVTPAGPPPAIANDIFNQPIPNSTIADQFSELSLLVMKLGVTTRGTRHPDGETRESVATHTIRVIITACVLAEALNAAAGDAGPRFDIGVVAQEAAVHDLVEAEVGDVDTLQLPSAEARARKQAAEDAAANGIFRRFGHVFPWMKIVRREPSPTGGPDPKWTREQRLVYFVDKLDPKVTHVANRCASPRAKGVTAVELTERYMVQRAELLADVVYDFPKVIALYDILVAREIEILRRAG